MTERASRRRTTAKVAQVQTSWWQGRNNRVSGHWGRLPCFPTQPMSFLPAAYQVTHRLNATTANTATVEVLAPSARQYTATGLKPESVYLFRITAQTRKGWGEAAEALVVTTEKRGDCPLGLGRPGGSQGGVPANPGVPILS